MKRLLVAGSRPISNATLSQQAALHAMYDRCREYVASLDPKTTILVLGGARGIDSIAETAADKAGIHAAVVKAPHGAVMALGKSAFLRRDDVMLAMADAVAVFRINESRGSTYVLKKAQEMGKLVHLDDVKA